jgi:pimeloyl-ACP methyl ester carboxylesterase
MSTSRQIVATRYGQVHLRTSGGVGPPLVLLHESPRSAAMWEAFQDASQRPTLALDRLGYGFSDPPPWAMSVEQFADCVVDALAALGLREGYDLIGAQAGALEAIEVASRATGATRMLGLFGLPLWSDEERAQLGARHAEQPLLPAEDGSHLQAAWRGRFAYRKPPYDLEQAHRRLIDYLLAPNPDAAMRAAQSYPIERKLRSLKLPLRIFSPRDELGELTRRVESLRLPTAVFVDLPDLSYDCWDNAPARMAELIDAHFPI